jgi:pyruvate dehydrogenase E2 component (dihydrolipoamide acetyltransferase)
MLMPASVGADMKWILTLIVAWLAMRSVYYAWTGPITMSTRRKLTIASYAAPAEGVIHGTLTVDVTHAMDYLRKKREANPEGPKVTLTALILKAIGVGMRACPDINGHIAFGEFIPSPTVDISALVFVEREEVMENGAKRVVSDLGNVKLYDADKVGLDQVAAKLARGAQKTRDKQNPELEDTKALMKLLPTWLLRQLVHKMAVLGAQLGIGIPALSVKPYPFGTCMVSSVGPLGIDSAFAPFTPWTHVPLTVTLCKAADRPVVRGGQVVVRKMMDINAVLDHRYVDGADVAKFAKTVKTIVEHPDILDTPGGIVAQPPAHAHTA